MIWKKAVEWVSGKAVRDRFDKRKLQQEIDIHKLYLLTSYFQASVSGRPSSDAVDQISAKSQQFSKEELKGQVGRNLSSQANEHISKIHEALSEYHDSTAADAVAKAESVRTTHGESAQRPQGDGNEPQPIRHRSGLAAAVGALHDRQSDTEGRNATHSSPAWPSAQPERDDRDADSFTKNTLLSWSKGSLEKAASAMDRRRPTRSTPVTEALGTLNNAAQAERSSNLGGSDSKRLLKLSRQQVSELVKKSIGFGLEVRKSGQAHGQAGEGLWISGKAGLGSLVAFYPGIVYPPDTHRQIPGYPRIDRNNDYLMLRYDDLVIDALPWTLKELPLESGEPQLSEQTEQSAQNRHSRAELWSLETRHPLAWAHYANHPSKGVQPNVVIAALDAEIPTGELWRRAYVPNVIARRPMRPKLSDSDDESDASTSQEDETIVIPSMGLVATRPLENEEILLNYRFSPHMEAPSWYTPVDKAEDKRRWA